MESFQNGLNKNDESRVQFHFPFDFGFTFLLDFFMNLTPLAMHLRKIKEQKEQKTHIEINIS